MDSFEFFPAQTSLKKGLAFDAFYLLLPLFLSRVADFSAGGTPFLGQAMIAGFALLGGREVFRGIRGLLRPTACFAADGEGFSVKGGRRWRWDALVDARIRRVRMSPIPAGT